MKTVVLGQEERAVVVAAALEAGFDLVGIAAVPLPGSKEDDLQQQRFREFIEAGHAGEMGWLSRADQDGNLLRSSLHKAIPWARSVIVCAANYNAQAPLSIAEAPEGAGWIARYAWSGAATGNATEGSHRPTDYHDVLLARLHIVEAALQACYADAAVQTRCYVDTGPVVERFFAQLAGIGWIGKNTCVLNQSMGSWLLLGVVLTSLSLAEEAILSPAPDRCGTCTRCIDACPTRAIVAAHHMDASRCIAYLTIEKKGAIPEGLREGMGRQVFGCDICQDVCPWNRRAPISTDPEMSARAELINPDLQWLAAMDNPTFRRTFKGSPLERTGRKRLHRNVAIAMGNSGDSIFHDQLARWAAGDDAVLAEAARWSLARLPRGKVTAIPQAQEAE